MSSILFLVKSNNIMITQKYHNFLVVLFYGNPQFKTKAKNESHSFFHEGKEGEYANPW
jgi:hypothetical protein